MTSFPPGITQRVWPLVKTQLGLGVAVTGLLFFLGKPALALGVLYGAVLGTVNAMVMAGRLEGAVQRGSQKGKRFLLQGVFTRFSLILLFMAIGFYFFKLHIAGLLVGFILFQAIALFSLWKEAKKGRPTIPPS